MNKKLIIWIIAIILLVSVVLAVVPRTQTKYNSFTRKLDYILKLDQSGRNFTAGNLTSNFNICLGFDCIDDWVNISGKLNSTVFYDYNLSDKPINDSIDTRFETANHTLATGIHIQAPSASEPPSHD